MEFKDRLQYLMDFKKISQADIVRETKINKSRVSLLVNGNVDDPRRSTIQKLASLFECNIDWLASGKGEIWPSKGDRIFSGNKGNIVGGSARDVHYIGEDQPGTVLPSGFLYLAELLGQLPNTDEYLQKMIMQVIQDLEIAKKQGKKNK